MTVTDKARDIAVLMSMGTRREQVRRIFLLQGITIGATGTIIGIGGRLHLFVRCRNFHLIPLDPQVYSVPFVPFHPSLVDGVWIRLCFHGDIAGSHYLTRQGCCQAPPGRYPAL